MDEEIKLQPRDIRREGLTVIHDPSGPKLDIIILHGLDGHPWRTFHDEETGFFWPSDLHRVVPHARIMVFGYLVDTHSGSSNALGIYQHADSLLLHLRNNRFPNLTTRPMVFIGHSLGGLVIKQALINSSRSHLDSSCLQATKLIFFLGTPHRGSQILEATLARLAFKIGKVANREIPAKIKPIFQPHGAESFIVNSEFMKAKGQIEIVNFYEQVALPKLGMLVVDTDSAVFDSQQSENVPVARDHRTLVRFKSAGDDAYRMLHETLKRKINSFFEVIENASNKDLIMHIVQECLVSLQNPNMKMDIDSPEEPHESTLRWLWNIESDFSKWLHNGQGLFFITGKPGSGKTLLMSAVVSRTQRLLLTKPSMVVIRHFFNARGHYLQHSVNGFLRSILVQVLKQEPCLFHYMSDEWTILTASGDQARGNSMDETLWNTGALKRAVRSVISHGSERFRILLLIDALDECTMDFDLVGFLSEISRGGRTESIQVLITSRHMPEGLAPSQNGSFRLEDRNGPDISNFINSQWDPMRHPHEPVEDLQRLKSELITKADGIFLWARLVLERISKAIEDGATIAEIRETTNDIPSQLSGIFDFLLDQINEKYKNESNDMLAIILAAVRPLSLGEFTYALALNSKGNFGSQAELESSPQFVASSTMMARRIQSRCGGLVEVRSVSDTWKRDIPPNTNSAGVVQFIHQAVKEFLCVGNSDPRSHRLEPEHVMANGHAVLAKACIQYIALAEVQEIPFRYQTGLHEKAVFCKLPFLRYAAENWIFHSQQAEKLGRPQGELIETTFNSSTNIFNVWFQIHDQLHPDKLAMPDRTLMYLTIENNLASFVRIQCSKPGFDVDARLGQHGSHLQLAVSKKSREVVRVLLDAGASCSQGDSTTLPPLYHACLQGNADIVSILLDAGADVSETTMSGSYANSALVAAAYSLNSDVVRLIIEHDPTTLSHPNSRVKALYGLMDGLFRSGIFEYFDNPDLRQIQSQTAKIVDLISEGGTTQLGSGAIPTMTLLWILTGCSDSVLRTLTESNEGVQANSYLYLLLGVACYFGTLASVRFLLEKDLDPNLAPAPFGMGSLLHLAAMNKFTSVLEYLVQIGLDINATNQTGRTPLHTATRESTMFHVEILLDNGADKTIRDVHGYTPFHYALTNSKLHPHHDLIGRLQVTSEDVNLSANDGKKPLHIVAASGSLQMVKWLLDTGADLYCRDDFSRTPLHAAAASASLDSPDLITFLINQGLDVNDEDDVGMTTLHHTLYTYDTSQKEYDPDVSLAKVKLLLQHGASLERQDSEGNTILHLAAWRGHLSLVKYLLSQGAVVSRTDKRGYRPVDIAQGDEVRAVLESEAKLLVE
ncbi:ankyrin repeat-containing domain protein [Xylariaceae sp. AK1471]|nr:ankyrin repeat-containing domain protein [Xylariaceae sp. AK1471]